MMTKKIDEDKASSRTSVKTDRDPELREFLTKALDEDKAIDIVTIDLAGKTALADYMIIATGTSSRHVSSMAQKIKERMKEKYGTISKIEGADSGDWVIVDAGDAIIHLFRPEIREFYNLEKLWGSDFASTNYTLYK